jgi:hypothetical protein
VTGFFFSASSSMVQDAKDADGFELEERNLNEDLDLL